MDKIMFLLFSHRLNADQAADARQQWGVTDYRLPPKQVQDIWSQLPADVPEIRPYLAPAIAWLDRLAKTGDLALIQGDFGATYIMVDHAKSLGMVPVYATTERLAEEKSLPGGAVRQSHIFKFRRFRVYGM